MPVEPEATALEADEHTPDTYDEFLTADVMLPRGGEQYMGTVRRRVKDDDGRPVGKRASNPILAPREYEVEFPGGSTDNYAANLIY